MASVKELLTAGQARISAATTTAELEQIKVELLGRKGQLTVLLRDIGSLPADQRPQAGSEINATKKVLQEQLKERLEALQRTTTTTTNQDVTLPGWGMDNGGRHPINQAMKRLVSALERVNFTIAEGPEIEDDFHNFQALNIPVDHPARAMHDTFYLDNELLLRTHTSPVQIRTMRQSKPPFRMICPGKVYRSDADVSHTPMFHQVEGLVVDERANFAELKFTVEAMLEEFFARSLTMRFRPSYFPFTEPSAEVDIACVNCDSSGCRVCGQNWLVRSRRLRHGSPQSTRVLRTRPC